LVALVFLLFLHFNSIIVDWQLNLGKLFLLSVRRNIEDNPVPLERGDAVEILQVLML
jgi:hypothetical protein